MMNLFAKTVLVGVLLVGGAATASAASLSDRMDALRDRLDQRQERIEERIDAAQQRICDRLEKVRERIGGHYSLPPYCDDNGGGDDDDDDDVALSFSADDTTVTEGDSVVLSWNSTNAESCMASGDWSGSKSLDGNQTVVVDETSTYTLKCENDDDSESKSVTVTAAPTGDDDDDEPSLSFSASPTTIDEGDTSLLSWDSTDADFCMASGSWSGSKSLDGSQSVSPNATSTYTLACGNENGTTTENVTVNVVEEDEEEDLPELTFSGTPTTIDDDESATLTWDSTNATLCRATGNWSGTKTLDGSQSVSPNSNATYTLACGNATGTTTKSVTIMVTDDDLPSLTFSASPMSIVAGTSSTLTWNSTDADFCAATGGWSGTKSVDGSQSVSPATTTTYTLGCGNENGTTTENVIVTVTPASEVDLPELTFTATPSSIDAGASSTLAWDSTDADTCVASGGWSGSKSLDGSQSVSPATTTTYTLTCENEDGETAKSVMVTVDEDEEPGEGRLVISEVFYDPITSTSSNNQGTESANEWVEIYNAGDAPVNMAEWYLEDASTVIEFFGTTTIPAGGYLIMTNGTSTAGFWDWPAGTVVVYLGNPIGNGLGNTGDALYLKSPEDAFIDAVSWGSDTSGLNPSSVDAPEGSSIARTNPDVDTNTNSDWAADATPTPGE